MRKSLFVIAVGLGLTASVAFSQASNLARTWTLVPNAGMISQVESALKAHMEWRKANGDTWTWSSYIEVVGPNFGTIHIRSGNHSWADFDGYTLDGAPAHFDQTVTPLLKSLSNVITAVDTTLVSWPSEDNFTLFSIAEYDLKMGKGSDFTAALKKYHEAIQEKNPEIYYAFDRMVSGGDGTNDVTGVFPQESWSGFEPTDPGVGKIMKDVYGEEEAGKILDQFQGSVRSISTAVLVYRPDLSVILDK